MNCNDEVTSIDRREPGGDSEHTTASSSSSDDANLFAVVDRDRVWGLNLADPDAAKIVIKPWDKREDMEASCESNVDDQFIITVPFICSVRLKSILINPGRGDFAPLRIRAYVNRPNGIDFEDVQATSTPEAPEPGVRGAPPRMLGSVSSGRPQADFGLLEQGGVTEYPVSMARFSNTNSVSIVVSDSASRDLVRLYYLGFKGTALQLEKEPGNRLDVAAANAADSVIDGVKERNAAAQHGGSVR